MKAVVLAAGTGQRFRPLTQNRPKPMLPVGNQPLLAHVVKSLTDAGIDELACVVGHQRERIQDYFGNGGPWDIDIQYVTQDHPRGTGDALLQAEKKIADDFLVVNGDRVIEPTLLEQLMEARITDQTSQIAVTQVSDPTQYGMVDTEGDRVTKLTEKPPAHAVTSQIINVGAYAFGPDIFGAIRRTDTHGELALTAVLDEYIDDHPLNIIQYDGMWFELTQPWDLLAANRELLDQQGGKQTVSARVHTESTIVTPSVIGSDVQIAPGARILQNTILGSNTSVGANAVLENSVILSDVTIGPGTVVRDAIIGANTTLGPNITIEGGTGDVIVDETLHTDVKFGGLIGDNVNVGGAVTIDPGAVIGNGATVAADATISGTIPNRSMTQ